MRILIGVFDESKLNLGQASWTGKSFEDIKSFFNDKLSEDFNDGKGIAVVLHKLCQQLIWAPEKTMTL